jgi:hypothetical protein
MNEICTRRRKNMWKVKSTTPRLAQPLLIDATTIGTEKTASKRLFWFGLALPLLLSGVTNAQYQRYPIMEGVATRVIQKYQQSSCEQLWQERGQPKSQREQEAVQALRNDPQMRAAFIDRIAAPIANKMFECGMIP